MTIFVYVSRTLKLRGRPKARLSGTPAAPSNLSWKRPPRGRGRPVKVLPFLRRQQRIRYQPSPPQPSNLVVQRWPRRWQRRRPLRQGLIRAAWRVRSPPPAQPSNLVIKRWPKRWLPRRPLRRGMIRALWRLRAPSPPAPAGFIWRKPLRPRLRRMRNIVHPRRYSIAGPPASVIAYRKPPRPRLRRMRVRPPRRLPALLPLLLLLARPLRRLRLKRARLRLRSRTYSIAGPPAAFIAFKKPLRPKIKKVKWSLRRFAQRLYASPVAPIVNAASEWLIRARRRGTR